MSIFAASGFYLLAAAGLLMMGLGGVPALLQSVLPGLSHEGLSLLTSVVYYGPFVLLPVLLWAARGNGRLESLRLNPISVNSTIRVAVMGVLCMVIVYDFTLLWMAVWQKLGLDVFATMSEVPETRSELTLCILNVALIVPVCEEMLFRGALLPAWEERGTKRGVLAAAALFAIFHGSLMGLPGQFFGGVMLALVVVWTDSLYAGIIFHGVYNASSVIMSYLGSGGAAEEAGAAAQTGIIEMMGGMEAVAVLLVDILLMAALTAALARGLRMNRALQRAGAKMLENGKFEAESLPKEALEELWSVLKDPVKRRKMKPEQLFGGEYMGSRGRLNAKEWLILLPAVGIAAIFYVMDVLVMLGG